MDFVAEAQIKTAAGRNVVLAIGNSVEGRTIQGIITEGANGPTNAQRQRSAASREALQGKGGFLENAFLQYILEPSAEFMWPESFPVIDTIPPIVTTRPLNESQRHAVKHMLLNTNETRISIIQGPPGTGLILNCASLGCITNHNVWISGKTTVIAAFVCSAVAAGATGIWLVAQSNIAVKNMAEKLGDVGFLDWRLLVSQDFHFGWYVNSFYMWYAGHCLMCIPGMSIFMARLARTSSALLSLGQLGMTSLFWDSRSFYAPFLCYLILDWTYSQLLTQSRPLSLMKQARLLLEITSLLCAVTPLLPKFV